MAARAAAPEEVRTILEALVAAWQRPDARGDSARALDPVFLVRRYESSGDREVAGLIAALFAYGRVELLCRAVESILDLLAPSPRAALLEGRHEARGFARGFRYRFQTARDLRGLLRAAARVLEEEGTLGRALASRRPAGEAGAAALDEALARLVADLRRSAGRDLGPGLRHLLADPASGSAGKRWRLYLRWMIRPDDGLDCGVWSEHFVPSDLTLPLDTHWLRLGPRLGWTARRTADLRMARDITDALRRVAVDDPLRYDLPICHLGIRGGCPPRLSPADCAACPLRPICATGRAARP
jgi:uncharacterized protein (TIGR02757 family)